MTNQNALSLKEAKARLGIGLTTLYKLMAMGKITAKKVGARTLIPAESIDAFLADSPAFISRGDYGRGERDDDDS
jgi:excisionase family DNA binding protein